MVVNREWYSTHVARVAALLEAAGGASSVQLWRADWEQDDQMCAATLAARGREVTLRIVRKFFTAESNSPMTAAEIVTFFGLAEVDPDGVVWAQEQATSSNLQVVRGMPDLRRSRD